jgi:hypothetical protein
MGRKEKRFADLLFFGGCGMRGETLTMVSISFTYFHRTHARTHIHAFPAYRKHHLLYISEPTLTHTYHSP